jgi:DNA-binding MarR family transcriptional regulator
MPARHPVTAPADPSRIGRPFTVQFGPNVAPVRRSAPALARRFYQMCMSMTADSVASADITSLQYGILSYLNGSDGEPGIDQNGLAARLGIDRSHVSLLVEELAVKGLIERRLNGEDRRVRLLHLTPKGEKLHRCLRAANRAATDKILEPLAPHERELFFDMLIRMIAANGALARPGAGRRKRRSQNSTSNNKSRPPPSNRT